ncbi:MAG: trypsin-like peptidase domain-containing protein, partial [Candidatus Izimaplasma sp.]|nr:trypsin-like peptidase domain-containing protein [Candidatus Izimaplasma bacterium]
MKKLILILTISMTVLLSGCTPVVEEPDVEPLTEEELTALIESLMPEANIETTYDLTSFQTAVTDMIAEARHGVIGIISISSAGAQSGSGVIYKKEGDTYYVVTNYHVVEGSTDLSVVFERHGVLNFDITNDHTEILGSDPTTDLAVFTFESTETFTVIPMADSYELALGQFVFAIGNPLGFDYFGTVTMGVVSGLTRYVIGDGFNTTLLQHDAAISPGNSGGALLNINGELVGINNMKLIDEYVTGIGFAIPSNTVRRITMDLEDDGVITRPYLGVISNPSLNVCGTEYGACIIEVQVGGAAESAGLIDFDTVVGYKVSSYDEFRIILNFDDLREAILNS